MRILHVDSAKSWRGGERQVFLLARGLARRGHECVVAARPKGALAERCRAAGIPVIACAPRGDLDLLAAGKLAWRLRASPPDILHLHTARDHAAGGLAARFARFSPVVVTRRLEVPIRGAFSRWKYRALGDRFVAISEAVERSLLAGGIPAERIVRIPSGVEIPDDGGIAVPREGPGRRVVGTLAAFTGQKDPATWIEVARRVAAERPTVDFVWWGEGPLRRSLQEIAGRETLGTRIDLSGFHEDLDPFWRRIDVFFLPSRFEALGTVLLDAMARSVPIVASHAGGIPEVARHGIEAELAAPGDVNGFVEAIGRVLDDPALARARGNAGRARARAFAIAAVIDRVESLYVETARGFAAREAK